MVHVDYVDGLGVSVSFGIKFLSSSFFFLDATPRTNFCFFFWLVGVGGGEGGRWGVVFANTS